MFIALPLLRAFGAALNKHVITLLETTGHHQCRHMEDDRIHLNCVEMLKTHISRVGLPLDSEPFVVEAVCTASTQKVPNIRSCVILYQVPNEVWGPELVVSHIKYTQHVCRCVTPRVFVWCEETTLHTTTSVRHWCTYTCTHQQPASSHSDRSLQTHQLAVVPAESQVAQPTRPSHQLVRKIAKNIQ